MANSATWDRLFDGAPITAGEWASAEGIDPSPRRRRRRRRSGSASKRLDVQGLRAVAVVAVVLNHLTTWLGGGFVGVDIFFVISGFLITGHLVSDTSARGHVSFRGFYFARARRILPAALVTLLVTWIAAGHVFKGARVLSIHDDVVWALGFGANIHFSRQGTNYFQANRPVSPVQHFWSLSVEEQFYLAWPLAIAIVMLLFGRRAHVARFKVCLLGLAGLAVIASFAFALHETKVAPTSAYFSTVVRAWELGLGAVLAVTISRFPNLPARLGRVRGPLAFLGLVGVVASLFVVKSAPGFPAPGAALPVVATAVVIFAGSAGSTGFWTGLLTNRLAVYVGDISYSLYLWHFPAILYIGALVENPSWARYAMTVLAFSAASIFSYHYIEQPFRRRPSGVTLGVNTQAFWLPLLATVALVTALLGVQVQRPAKHVAAITFAAPGAVAAATAADPDAVTPSASYLNGLKASIQATKWPSLTPPLNKLDLTTARSGWGKCFDLEQTESLRDCRFSNSATDTPGKVAVVLGDSVAVSWLPAIRAALVPQGWAVYGITHGLCPGALVRVDDKPKDPTTAGDCDNHHAWMVTRTLGLKPSLVILSQALNTLTRLRSNATGSAALLEYQQGLQAAQTTFTKAGAKVVNLSPPPEGAGLTTCNTVGSVPGDCVTRLDSDWMDMEKAERLAAAATGTIEINTSPWFCYQSYCPGIYGSTAIFYDQEHITAQFAASLGPEMAAALHARKAI